MKCGELSALSVLNKAVSSLSTRLFAFYFTRFASKAHTCLLGCILGVNVLHNSAIGHRQRTKVYFYHSLFHSSLVGWMGGQNCSDKPFLLRSESTKWKSDLWKGWLKYRFDCFLERTPLAHSFPVFERGHLSTYASCGVGICFLFRQLSQWWHGCYFENGKLSVFSF